MIVLYRSRYMDVKRGRQRYLLTKLLRKWANDNELYELYASYDITKVIKSSKLKWAAHITRLREDHL